MIDPEDNIPPPDIHALFAKERTRVKPDPERIIRISRRIQQEHGFNDLSIMIFARFWMTLLQMGAIFYTAASKRQPLHKPAYNSTRHSGRN